MKVAFSRRDMMKLATAGACATLPAVASAASDREQDHDQAQLSDAEQLDTCIAQLKTMLIRMYPDCDPPKLIDTTTRRGSRCICITVLQPSVPFTGDGLYKVEIDNGFEAVCHVRKIWSEMDRCYHLYAAIMFDGHPVGPREIVRESALIRKLEG